MRKILKLWAYFLNPFNEILAILELSAQIWYHFKRAVFANS